MSNTNFQELNLSNAFLFTAALEDPITCRLVLECIVEESISELSVRAEYTKQYNSEFKYIRLDVYAKDTTTEVSYNLEMQNKNQYNLPLRSRYYQAQIDVGNLKPGDVYSDLKPVYIIFICNFDPFGEELYQYTFSMQCKERNIPLNDGAKRIFLSTKGKNKEEVPQILVDFLGYLNDSTDKYVEQSSNEKVKEIHGRVKELKKNQDVEKRYMHYLVVDRILRDQEQLVQKQEAELQKQEAELQKQEAELQKQEAELQKREAELQKQEAELQKQEAELLAAEDLIKEMIFERIKVIGNVSEAACNRIKNEKDVCILKSINEIVKKALSIEQFENQIANL